MISPQGFLISENTSKIHIRVTNIVRDLAIYPDFETPNPFQFAEKRLGQTEEHETESNRLYQPRASSTCILGMETSLCWSSLGRERGEVEILGRDVGKNGG